MKKKFQALLITSALCLSFSAGVLASSNETISATLNRLLTIKINGETQTFKDAGENTVYPLTYNGTTYLPVRSLANIFGFDVEYDANSYSVLLGTFDYNYTPLTSLSNTGNTKYSYFIIDKSELDFSDNDENLTFNSGLIWNQWNGSSSYFDGYGIEFDVSNYSTLTFSSWSEVDTNIVIFDQDGNSIYSFSQPKDELTTKTIDISNYDVIAFGSKGNVSEKGTIKILDPLVK